FDRAYALAKPFPRARDAIVDCPARSLHRNWHHDDNYCNHLAALEPRSHSVGSIFSADGPRNAPTACKPSTLSQTALKAITIGTPNNSPQTPHSHPQTRRLTNTVTALTLPTFWLNQGT